MIEEQENFKTLSGGRWGSVIVVGLGYFLEKLQNFRCGHGPEFQIAVQFSADRMSASSVVSTPSATTCIVLFSKLSNGQVHCYSLTTCSVIMHVVDGLEIIQINGLYTKRALGTIGTRDGLVRQLIE